MPSRLRARIEVDALRRLVEAAGGHATVLARGDADAGTVLVVTRGRDGTERAFERSPAALGAVRWDPAGQEGEAAAYVARRRSRDPDLWVVEVSDVADPVAVIAGLTG